MTFGEVLTILRKRAGLSIEELAYLVDWHPHRIRAFEYGTQHEPPTNAEALDVDSKLLTVYTDGKGNELMVDQNYGVTKADNSFFMKLAD